jgi:hypothetical protein
MNKQALQKKSCFGDPVLKQLQLELLDMIKDGDLEMIKLLFESPDGIRFERELLETKDKDKKTILHLVSSMLNNLF